MRFLHDFEAGFTLLTYNLKVHFTFLVTSILAPPLPFVHIAHVRVHPSFIPVHDTWYINLFGCDFWNYS